MESARSLQRDNVVPIRPLPHDVQAEKALLGSMMLGREGVIPQVRERVQPEDFYFDDHQHLARALFDLGRDADFVTLKNHLQHDHGEEKATELVIEIAKVADQISTAAGFRHWADIVRNCAERRSLIALCRGTESRLLSPHEPHEEIAAELRDGVRSLRQSAGRVMDPLEMCMEMYHEVMRRVREKDHTVGPLTGFEGIDKHLAGLEPGATYYIGAQSKTGKSALALQIADQVDQRVDGHVLYFTLESTVMELNMRRAAREAGIALTRIRRGHFRDVVDQEEFTRAVDRLSASKVWVSDDTKFSDFEALRAHCETFAMERDLSLVVVDFLQLMQVQGRFNSEHHKYKELSIRFNQLAKDLKVPVFILSQLNEEGSLKESRDLHNNAIHEWILERNDQQDPIMRVRGTKAKNTGPWYCKLRFNGNLQRFTDYESAVPEGVEVG